jgi:hypothetical protein
VGVQVQPWQTTDADLARIRSLGFGVVRWGLPWEQVEKTPARYDWRQSDLFLERLARYHLRSLIILGGGNAPFTGTTSNRDPMSRGAIESLPPTRPRDIASFAAFAAMAAQRYSKQRPIWEIWNEPDLSRFWPPSADPAAYVALASTTCAAMKAADPSAPVIGPGSASMPDHIDRSHPDILALLAGSPAGGCFDAISAHDYRYGATGGVKPPESVEADNQQSLLRIKATLGWRAPVLICSEWGFATPLVTPAEQSYYPVRALLANLLSGVSLTILYEWRDAGNQPTNPEHNYGLATFDGHPKPGMAVMQSVLAPLAGARSLRALRVGQSKDIRIAAVEYPAGKSGLVFWLTTPRGSAPSILVAGRRMAIGLTPTFISFEGRLSDIAVRE